VAWAKPSRGQAAVEGFGLAWDFRKPRPPQARPKPRLSGQAGPEHHYCQHSRIITLLSDYMHKNANKIENTTEGNAHCIWLGDFNRHHPYWDDPKDTHLFTRDALNTPDLLIEGVAEAGLEMMLPNNTPTHLHNVSECWSRLDNVFLSDHSTDVLISCDTLPDLRGICTNHLPILTKLDLTAQAIPPKTTHNFRKIDWDQFCKALERNLASLNLPTDINTQAQLDASCTELTNTIQETINTDVPTTMICAKSKRWWTKEFTKQCKEAKRLGR
jgi:Endonuclease-reverse transcriptase